jgi:hypothetical protein
MEISQLAEFTTATKRMSLAAITSLRATLAEGLAQLDAKAVPRQNLAIPTPVA